MEYGTIELPSIYVFGCSAQKIVRLDATYGGVANQTFRFDALIGGNVAPFGLWLDSPPANDFRCIVQNIFEFNLIGACTCVCIQEGSAQINPDTQALGTNIFRGAATIDHAGMEGLYATFGQDSQAYFSSLSTNQGTANHAVIFNTGSRGNYVVSPQLPATISTQIVQNGTNNKCVTPPY